MAVDNYNTWQSFAEAASVEHDSEKLAHLIQQLNNALDKEERKNSSDEILYLTASQPALLSALCAWVIGFV